MTAMTGKQNILPGNYVTFGHYPQTADGRDDTPIEWLVLDVQDGKALLLSKYGLDTQPYNEELYSNVKWDACSLRTWLNDVFLNKAFTAGEQIKIATSYVFNDSSEGYRGPGCSGTKDKIFLLSYKEANRYLGVGFHVWDNMKSRVQPTGYARAKKATVHNGYHTADGAAAGHWWLRSSGTYGCAELVECGGSLIEMYTHAPRICVRPAMWVDLSAEVF